MLKALTRDQLRDGVSADVSSKKRRGKEKKRKQKKKTKVGEKPVETAGVAKEEEKAEISKASEITKLAAANRVEISDNIVLRKLLRGPRYFDPPDSVWRTCYNCGEGGHTTASCSTVKRKKPCFVCGSLEHNAKQCKKGRDCFTCEKGGHLAKNCPEKYERGSQNSKLCLKCGDFCHDMFSCKNDYSPDDLKEIQCYICNSFGHLCCAAFGDIGRREPSCYRCGQLGHTGLECQRSRGERTSVGPLSACFKCGEEGHFALECTSSTKAHKRNLDLGTPTRKFHKGNRETVGVRSVPSDSGKSHERKMGQYEGGRFSTPPNAIRSDGWITQYPGNLRGYAQVPGWGSPVIPTYNGNLMYTPIADGHASSSYSLRRAQELHFGPLASNVSPIFYQNIYSPSIYDNFSSYGTRSNYYW